MQAIELKDIQVILGTVVQSFDDKKLGRVKVAAPGIFDLSVMDEEALPWVYPFSMSGFQTYSRLQNGSKVWLIYHKTTQEEYWYLPFHELNENTKEFIGEDEESDVLISREVCGKTISIYQNKTEGLHIQYGTSLLTFNQEGQILLDSNGISVKIENGKVYLGSTENDEYERMVRGDKLMDILSTLSSDLNKMATACQNPYILSLQEPLLSASSNIQGKLNDLLSDTALVGK